MTDINANLLEFFGHPRPAIAAEAQARLFLDMRQNDHIHALPATGWAIAERPQTARADVHDLTQPVDWEGPTFAIVARTNGATWLTLRRTETSWPLAREELGGFF